MTLYRDRVLSAHPVPSAWGPAVVLGTHVCVAEQHDASTDQVVRMVNRTTGIPARVPLSTGIINGMAAVDDHLVGILVTTLGGEPSIISTPSAMTVTLSSVPSCQRQLSEPEAAMAGLLPPRTGCSGAS